MLARITRRAAVAALFPLLFAAACGHAAAPVPPPVMLSYCGSNLQATPNLIEVVCNTDDITARNLVWRDWGKSAATATGTATIDQCAYVDCHTGSFGAVPIRLIASKITACAKNVQAYSTLRYVFPDGTPWPGVPANFTSSGFMAGANRPVPPPNQTVSLTC